MIFAYRCLCSTMLVATTAAALDAQACMSARTRTGASVQSRTSNHRDGALKTTSIQSRRGDCELRLDARGDYTVRPDLRAFQSVDDYVEVEERTGDHDRKVRVTSRGGVLDYRWTVDGTNGFDVDREKWLGDMLLAIERLSGAMAKTRVPMILKQGGVDAVLDETVLLAGDYAKRMYFNALFANARLTENQSDRLLGQAADSMASDYERAELLRSLADQGPMTDRLARGVIHVAERMSSDYEKRRALGAGLAAVATPQSRAEFFHAASTLSSSYELAELLIAAQQRRLVDSLSSDEYFKAIERLSSDFERRRTLSSLLKQRPTTFSILCGVLRASRSIDSDFELATLLVEFAGVTPVRGDLREMYLEAAQSISSDYEYRRALQALLDQDRHS